VIRDEVEHEPEATRPESVAEASQSRIAAQARVHGVAGDGEPGADDVLLAQVRQGLLELAPPLGFSSSVARRPRIRDHAAAPTSWGHQYRGGAGRGCSSVVARS